MPRGTIDGLHSYTSTGAIQIADRLGPLWYLSGKFNLTSPICWLEKMINVLGQKKFKKKKNITKIESTFCLFFKFLFKQRVTRR